jgi:hypothetical protein
MLKTFFVLNKSDDLLSFQFDEGGEVDVLPGNTTFWTGCSEELSILEDLIVEGLIDVWTIEQFTMDLEHESALNWQLEGF